MSDCCGAFVHVLSAVWLGPLFASVYTSVEKCACMCVRAHAGGLNDLAGKYHVHLNKIDEASTEGSTDISPVTVVHTLVQACGRDECRHMHAHVWRHAR